jgi:23S rRNA pseudouridine1911/1915/1917 synthase
MPFWTYMLHCRGGKFYVGHTEDLERRLGEHQSGRIVVFTADRLPVELVWAGELPTRHEALAFELQIKGWSRAKKMALIRGDWERISTLAKSKNDPSTSSGRTDVVEGTIPASGPSSARLDKALAEATGFSRARVQGLIEQGRVDVAGKTATAASMKVAADMPFRIIVSAAMPAEAVPEDIALTVAYEDAHLIVVDKPAGMVVHPAVGNITGTLVNALLHHCRGQLSGINGIARPGIVHRIDKDTSGLLVVAKSNAAHEGLAVQFAAHTVHRRYVAVCAGHPSPAEGTVNARVGRSDSDRKKMTVLPNNSSRGKTAITHYKVLERLDEAAVIECRLETGRTHQVRVHCASIGHPLLGDPAYGRTPKSLRETLERLGFARQALHAAELGFMHPVTGENVQFRSDLPPDMAQLIDQLRHTDR